MEELRKRINAIDDEILKLISERVALAEEIGKIKKELGIPIKNEEREAVVIERYIEYGTENDLNTDSMIAICKALITLSIEKEME